MVDARFLALLRLTRSASLALPSGVSRSQQREHRGAPESTGLDVKKWTPRVLPPHAWQVSGCQGVPAFWRAYQSRWRWALVGSGMGGLQDVGAAGWTWNLGPLRH